MASEITVFPGRIKSFSMQWRSGGASGPPMDTTGATFTVLRITGLAGSPTIAAVNESLGQYTLTLDSTITQGKQLGSFFSFIVALTLPGPSVGYSPDPVTIQGVFQ